MKREVDSRDDLVAWMDHPEPAVFQGQDLIADSARISKLKLTDCVFLGCKMETVLAESAAAAGCFVIPVAKGLPFDPFSAGLYSVEELYDKFDAKRPESYDDCLDSKIYLSYMDPRKKKMLDVDVDTIILRRVHDASIAEALDDLLDDEKRQLCVAIMGGHDMARNAKTYASVAKLAQDLTLAGYMVVTGGGPGLMEAANLGAYTAGFRNSAAALDLALAELVKSESLIYSDKFWLRDAFLAKGALGNPDNDLGRSVGIPTWFYGHEPPNVFATDIAKYFENSVREEGMLAVAYAGVIFAEGSGGTVQEIFQDACQNYYRTYGSITSPMILLGEEYWDPSSPLRHDAMDRRKPLYPLLEKLATEKGFSSSLLITDDYERILKVIKKASPIKVSRTS